MTNNWRLYYKLRADNYFKKYKVMYLVTNIKQMKTYPTNEWGIGYWRNK